MLEECADVCFIAIAGWKQKELLHENKQGVRFENTCDVCTNLILFAIPAFNV